jgi:DNA-binding NarL/FixJ family response regulator
VSASTTPIPWRAILGYGAVAGLVLVCLRIASFAPVRFDWGREAVAAAVTLVAVVVGMQLARRPTAAAPEARPPPPPPADPVGADLGITPRERQILGLLDRGMTNKELAAALGVSENTVKTHLANLYAKLGVGRRTEALSVARQRGIVA